MILNILYVVEKYAYGTKVAAGKCLKPHEMITFDPVKRVLTFVTICMITLSLASCASHHKKHKKLKPGKEIPCPLKDC